MPPVDVCVVVEGSYPYVRGGVAKWTHDLLLGLPDITFALVTLVPDAEFTAEDKYPVPPNVLERHDVYLFGDTPHGQHRESSRKLKKQLEEMHDIPAATRCPYFHDVLDQMNKEGQTAFSLQTSRSSWELLTKLYEQRKRQISFLDYFWSWRATHGPIFRLIDAPLPDARVYHALSTGYAGLLAAVARHRMECGMVLTEHGIYVRERQMEISQAEWIFTEPREGSSYTPREPFFKRWWREQYQFLASLAYDTADRVVALQGYNARHQVAAGARVETLVTIGNGVDVPRFAPLRAPRDWSNRPFRVGFIGRVVPIKDVITFLQAIAVASEEIELEAFILGPTDEDPAYFQECLSQQELLGIEKVAHFKGAVSVEAWLPDLDVTVLTSLSESQPLAILEGWAAGIPSIATDVGACREMIEGVEGEDALLGPAGIITAVASPGATAAAIVALARDPGRHSSMTASGIARVERYYQLEGVFNAYRQLYREVAAMAEPPKAKGA
ncbi:MAG: glycosyl transferase, group 1 [Cyanobacteria bacterium RYN_339]|nr:glycosyl transferase, group 1 [Cyanobacteria bacterium RYN_339]